MCVLHTHSMYAQLASLLDPTERMNTLKITHLEMIKGVGNHAYNDTLEVPIIENQPSEDKLAPDLEMAILAYPKCNAVLVRRHGVYVWGDSWEQAKTQLECFDYLFETAFRMKSLGIDCGVVPYHSDRNQRKKNHHQTTSANGVKILPTKTLSKKRSRNEVTNGIASKSAIPTGGMMVHPHVYPKPLQTVPPRPNTGNGFLQPLPQAQVMFNPINYAPLTGVGPVPGLYYPPIQYPNINHPVHPSTTTNHNTLLPSNSIGTKGLSGIPKAAISSSGTFTTTTNNSSNNARNTNGTTSGFIPKQNSSSSAGEEPLAKKTRLETVTTTNIAGGQLQKQPINEISTTHSLPIIPKDSKTVILTLTGCIVPTNFLRDFVYPFVLNHVEAYFDQLSYVKISYLLKKLNVDTSTYTKGDSVPTSTSTNNSTHVSNNHPKSNTNGTTCSATTENDNSQVDTNCEDNNNLDLNTKRMVMKAYVKAMVKYNVNGTEFQELVSSIISWAGAAGTPQQQSIQQSLFEMIFKDIEPFFKFCFDHGVHLHLYSSESLHIQNMVLMRGSDNGENSTMLTNYIKSRHNTTSIGPTKIGTSFVKLRDMLKMDKKDWSTVVFLSESKDELEAAIESGLGYPVLCRRSGLNNFVEKSPYPVVKGLGLMALTAQNEEPNTVSYNV